MIYNYVILGFIQYHIFDNGKLTFFAVLLHYVQKWLHNHVSLFYVVFIMSQLCQQCFCYNNTFSNFRIKLVFDTFKLCTKTIIITLVTGSSLWDISYYITIRYSRFLKILFTIKLEISYLQVRCNYVRMKNTIQLLLMFGRHFGITFLGKLQYNCFAHWVVILRLCVLWYVCIMYVNNLIVTSLFFVTVTFFFQ